jgi:hypothetical protein
MPWSVTFRRYYLKARIHFFLVEIALPISIYFHFGAREILFRNYQAIFLHLGLWILFVIWYEGLYALNDLNVSTNEVNASNRKVFFTEKVAIIRIVLAFSALYLISQNIVWHFIASICTLLVFFFHNSLSGNFRLYSFTFLVFLKYLVYISNFDFDLTFKDLIFLYGSLSGFIFYKLFEYYENKSNISIGRINILLYGWIISLIAVLFLKNFIALTSLIICTKNLLGGIKNENRN